MSAPVSFGRRLLLVVLPTKLQGFLSLLLAIATLAAVQFNQVLALLGINEPALKASGVQLHDRFAGVMASSVASNVVLVTFWATVGLIAYLVCWSAYNLLIEARNEVTLNTQYTNRGHWKGALETLAVKAISGVFLISLVALLKPGLALWITLSAPVFIMPGLKGGLALAGAVLGLALHLYLIYAAFLLTVTPWYREEAFTDI